MNTCISVPGKKSSRIVDPQGFIVCEYEPNDAAVEFSYLLLSEPHTVVPINGRILKYDDKVKENLINIVEKHDRIIEMIDNYTPEQWDRVLALWTEQTSEHLFEETVYDEYGEITEVGTYHICFNVADFLATLFGSKYGSWKYIETNWDWLLRQTGVFKLEIENSYESHGLVIYISDGTIRIYQGYGGHIGIIYVEENLDIWKSKLFDLFNTDDPKMQISLVLDLFRFPEDIFVGFHDNRLIKFNPKVLCCRLC